MPREDSTYPQDWLPYAEQDWQRVRRLLDADDPGLAGFCLQQAVEKFLKAYLLDRGWTLRKIHNLDALLTDAVTHDSSLENFRVLCQTISAFYFVERYPAFPGADLTREDVEEARKEAAPLIERLREGVGGASDSG